MGKHVAQEVKGGGVFLIGPDYAGGKEFLAGFQTTFQAAGGKVAGQQMTPFGKTTNFQPYLAAIRSSGAKAVFAFYSGAEAVGFVKQYKELGLAGKVPLYACGFLTEGSMLKAQGDAATGIQTALHYSSELDNPRNKEFVAAYAEAYGETPPPSLPLPTTRPPCSTRHSSRAPREARSSRASRAWTRWTALAGPGRSRTSTDRCRPTTCAPSSARVASWSTPSTGRSPRPDLPTPSHNKQERPR